MYILYKVTNKINNKIYIGYTSKTLEQRRITHYYDAKFHGNRAFLNALNKYNELDFIWEELLGSKSREEILIQEQNFIKLLKSNVKGIGYNLTDGGEGGSLSTPYWLNKKRDQETMKKLQAGREKYNKEHGTSAFGKEVTIIDLNTGMPLFFKSISQTAKFLNITKKVIYNRIKKDTAVNNYKIVVNG